MRNKSSIRLIRKLESVEPGGLLYEQYRGQLLHDRFKQLLEDFGEVRGKKKKPEDIPDELKEWHRAARLSFQRLEQTEKWQRLKAVQLNVHFSPDGRWVIFRSNMHGPSHIYAVDLTSSKLN